MRPLPDRSFITCPAALLFVSCFFMTLIAKPVLGAQIMPTHAELLAEEATLHDIQFVDEEYGWAVGDRGVVLRTVNGGRTWVRQPTPVECPLYSISFVDKEQGWAVGGEMTPYTHKSIGIVLHTKNGGRSWKRVDKGMVSRLRSVTFFNDQHGIIAGDGTSFNPSGVYQTHDGGLGWQPLPGDALRCWSAAHLSPNGGALVGARGASGRLIGSEVQLATNFPDRRAYRAVRMIDTANGWLAGDGGLVRTTRDGGKTWRSPPADVPEALTEWFDWQTIAAEGMQAWVAGSPGSVILHTADAGQSWQTLATPIPTPIHDLEFINDRQGWAVGSFGKIMATTDGGKTWRIQRHGERRAAISVQIATPTQMPAEVIASHAVAEGYRTVAHLPLLPESQNLAVNQIARINEASLHCGMSEVSTGWKIPLESRDSDLSLSMLETKLSERSDGDAIKVLSQSIAKHLLTYRPEIVVTPSMTSDQPALANLLAKATEQALVLAANHSVTETNLTAWKPARHMRVGPDKAGVSSKEMATPRGHGARFSTGDFSSLLGDSPASWTRLAWGLLSDSHYVAPVAYRWHTATSQSDASAGATSEQRRDLLAGLAVPRNDVARRPNANLPIGRLDQMRRIAQKRRNMERLLAVSKGNPAWAGQVVNLTGGLDADSGADLLHQLAEGYRTTGRSDLAADAYYLLARRYSESPLAEASLVWLVNYYASGEEAYALSRESAQAARQPKTLSNLSSTGLVPPLADTNNALVTGTLSSEERWERAARLADYLEATHPTLYADPRLRLTVAAAQRSRGYGTDAKKAALLLSKQTIADDWRRAARVEQWLSKPEGLPPEKPLANCRATRRRPKLDGMLNDIVWTKAEPITLQTESSLDRGEPTTQVYFAHDTEFLYFAARVPHSKEIGQKEKLSTNEPRPRDANLREQDRLHLRIDLDRDYQTAYELTIDHRGWTRDSLWGDRNWDPTWFVASIEEATEWRIEVAIPLSELLPPEDIDRAAWAVSIDHLEPNEMTTSWANEPATSQSPDAFGLLLFQ